MSGRQGSAQRNSNRPAHRIGVATSTGLVGYQREIDKGMQNQAPLSPARVLYDELRENEYAGLLDIWPTPGQADEQAAAPDDALPGPEEIPEPTPAFATRGSPAASHGDIGQIDKVERIHAVTGKSEGDSLQSDSALSTINRLQSSEIERLTLENERLEERMDAVNQLIEDEQNRRRSLDRQLREASLRNEPPAPAFDVEEIRRAAREGMSAEIKPVLTAILDLLESALSRGAETIDPAAANGDTRVPAPANLVKEVIEDFQQLPQILTRPIEELMDGSRNADLAPVRIVNPPEQAAPQETRIQIPRPPRHRERSSAMPSIFAWTNPFS